MKKVVKNFKIFDYLNIKYSASCLLNIFIIFNINLTKPV